jgi:hypothetical protein
MKTLSAVLLPLLCALRIATAGVQFDGTSGYVDIGTSSTYNFSNTTFTIIGFFSSSNDDGYVFAKRSISTDPGGYFFRVNADGTGSARIVNANNSSSGQRNTVSATLRDGNLHCIAVIFTTNTTTLASNDLSIYYDAVLDQDTRTDSGAVPYTPGSQKLVFGALSDGDSSGWLTGVVENFSVYGTALSAENITRYCSGKVRYGGYAFSGLISSWPFDECTEGASVAGLTFNDRSKAGSNGVGTGGSTCKISTKIGYAVGVD